MESDEKRGPGQSSRIFRSCGFKEPTFLSRSRGFCTRASGYGPRLKDPEDFPSGLEGEDSPVISSLPLHRFAQRIAARENDGAYFSFGILWVRKEIIRRWLFLS